MDNIRILPTPSKSPLALSRDGSPVPIRWVEDLFARLSAILGGAMSNVYANADPDMVKAEWAEALAGFTADEVKRGIAATRTRKFAPNLGEFLHLCRPALDAEVAWIEAEKGLRSHADGIAFAWSHPAVYWAARDMAFDIRSGSFQHMRKRWERQLAERFAEGFWASPPDPTARRIAPPSQQTFVPADKERVSGMLRSVREKLTGFSTKAEHDAAVERGEELALRGDGEDA